MTTPTSDDPYPPLAEATDQEQPPPFDDAMMFDLDKQVELSQLTDEIGKAVKRQVTLAQIGPDSGIVPAPDNPAKLAVTPGNLDRDTIQKVIDDHEPMLGYDIPEREKAYLALQDRLINDPDAEISDDDLKVAVRGLVQRMASAQPTGPL